MHASLFLLLYNSMSRNELESRGRFLHIPGAMLGVEMDMFVQRDLFYIKFKGGA